MGVAALLNLAALLMLFLRSSVRVLGSAWRELREASTGGNT